MDFSGRLHSEKLIAAKERLVMAILNVTPDSFSDGGNFLSLDAALKQTERHVAEGADILDIGGESTRPNAVRISVEEEINRVAPVIEAIKSDLKLPFRLTRAKAEVAEKAVESGAEIINDVSGLRFDESTAKVAAKHKTGLILMRLRGVFETMHKQIPVENIIADVAEGFRWSIEKARDSGVADDRIALDPGIGFSKTFAENLELLAKLDKLIAEFPEFPMLVGVSRKSLIGKILGNALPEQRLAGSLAAAAIGVWNGASIVRVHDVKATVDSLKIIDAVKKQL